jgi:flagellar hook-basal body complex protein FliE
MSDVAISQVLAQMRALSAAAQAEAPRMEEGQGPSLSFSALMAESIEQVNAAMVDAKAQATAFERGDPNVSLVEVMVASQRAGLQFQAMTEVRNKLLTAYQEIMSMQV